MCENFMAKKIIKSKTYKNSYKTIRFEDSIFADDMEGRVMYYMNQHMYTGDLRKIKKFIKFLQQVEYWMENYDQKNI